MLIEAASLRLAIDLLESLRKIKLNAFDIRLSFINKTGEITFQTFSDLDLIKKYYLNNYNRLINSKRDPFTKNRINAQLTPIVKNGIIIGNISEPLNDSNIQGLCSLGKFIGIESFSIISSAFNYDLSFKCIDVSGNYKIIKNIKNNIRKNSIREIDTNRHRDAINNLLKDYQIILKRLHKVYRDNLYVNLCYVDVGYVKETILLYSIFFALVKEKIDSGLRLSVLEPRYLRKIN